MAFDARREDYQRMFLRFARTLNGTQASNVREFSLFGQRFMTNRDSLPQTDADRAFHLVADATMLIDYELPFATDEEAETIVARGQRLLDEALTLDMFCHDALRMRQMAETETTEEFYSFLREREQEVCARCEETRASAERDPSPERAELGASIALRPYLRWLASLARKALECGRNREALGHVERLLEIDPRDTSDVRFTAVLAYAKLEDEQGLDQLDRRVRGLGGHAGPNAWMRLALASLAHKRCDLGVAREQIGRMVCEYPMAVITLAHQRELPDGVFARLATPPYSEDELIVAVSEGAILLQEGRDDLGIGAFGSWVLREVLGLATPEQLEQLRGSIGPTVDYDWGGHW